MVANAAPGCAKTRQVYNLWTVGPDIQYNTHNNNFENVKAAIFMRVFFVRNARGVLTVTPQPLRGVFRGRLGLFRRKLLYHLPETAEWSVDEYVDSYTGRRKTVYKAAAEVFLDVGVSREDSFLKSFLKCEKINFTAKPDPDPRLIQPRSAVYNVAVGRYIRPLEHSIYRSITKIFGEVTVAKGLNAQETGALMEAKWKKFRRPVAVGLDAKRFDQHCSLQAIQWEQAIYNTVYRDPDFRMWMSWQQCNTGYCFTGDGFVKYRTRGTRCSGDMNTGLGNCMIMCAMVWSYMQHIGVRKFSLVNNGDDCVVMMESRHLARFSAQLPPWFMDMGYDMKVEAPVYELEEIEFCQCHPVFDGTGYIMVRNFPTSVSKDLASYRPVTTETAWNTYRKSIADCGLALTGGLPVLPAFYKMLGRGAGTKVAKIADNERTGMDFMRARLDRSSLSYVHPNARVSFFLAFGVTPDQQVALEEFYDLQVPVYNDPLPTESYTTIPIY
jgi:hypothetical protein